MGVGGPKAHGRLRITMELLAMMAELLGMTMVLLVMRGNCSDQLRRLAG
jgi:hypothetical protein